VSISLPKSTGRCWARSATLQWMLNLLAVRSPTRRSGFEGAHNHALGHAIGYLLVCMIGDTHGGINYSKNSRRSLRATGTKFWHKAGVSYRSLILGKLYRSFSLSLFHTTIVNSQLCSVGKGSEDLGCMRNRSLSTDSEPSTSSNVKYPSS
jgi:hypothetical protein